MRRTSESVRRAATERLIRLQTQEAADRAVGSAEEDEEAGLVVGGALVEFGRLDITPLTSNAGEAGGFVLG